MIQKRTFQKRAIFLALITLILLVGSLARAQESAELQQAPLNPEFIQYQQEVNGESEDGHALGYVPSPIKLPQTTTRLPILRSDTPLPAVYDLRTLGRVSPVRDQGLYNSCWAFATYGSMESCLLPAETWDFSENNLKNNSGFNKGNGTGNYDMTTAYLTRWSGPVGEDDDPYASEVSPNFPIQKHVQQVDFLPARTGAMDNDLIKRAIMDHGGIYTAIYFDFDYYNETNYSYYFPGAQGVNHAVVIVGWDDNYPASNFSTRPRGNGAFIVKNSWGTELFGESGYFYISYYDTLIGYDENGVFFNAEGLGNYSQIYQYDPFGWNTSFGYDSPTAWAANVFTAAQAESLTAIGFYNSVPGTQYQIQIYTNVTSGGPTMGNAQFGTAQTGTVDMPGYHTIPLNSSVLLTAGQKFSVVIKFTTPGYNYPISCEEEIQIYARATANPGESYTSPDGSTWSDLTDTKSTANVCIKAYTNKTDRSLAANYQSIYFTVSPGNSGGKIVTLYNSGLQATTVNSVTINNVAFSHSFPATPFILGAKESKTFHVTFSPTTGTAEEGDLVITSDAADNSMITIPLYGNLPANEAQVVSDTIPDTMVVGQSYNVSITVKNTGANIWTADSGYSLGAVGGSDPFTTSLYQNLVPKIYANPVPGDAIAPGREKTFSFTMTAPSKVGTYTTDWQMVQNDETWFGGTFSKTVTVTLPPNDAQVVGDTIPNTMLAGHSYNVNITIKNIGTSTWTATSCYSLGAVEGWDPFTASLYQNLALGDAIAPGREKTFSFTMTAPSMVGTYTTNWQMSQNSMTWFGPTVSKTVTVSKAALLSNDAEIVSDTIPENMAAGQSYMVNITVRNTGTNMWTAVNGYKLSAVGGADPFTTTSDQDLSLMDSIVTHGTKTFTFIMTAPATAGAYTTNWRMNQNGLTWFGGTFTKLVTVNEGPWPKFKGSNKNSGLSPYVGAQTNNLKWSYTTKSTVVSSPVIGADGTIYVGSDDFKLYAINPNGTLNWSYTTGGCVNSSPAIGTDGTIYVGSCDDNLYAINPDGTLKWSYKTGSCIADSSPAIGADGTIYVGSDDKKLYAINPNGTLKWSYTTGSWVRSSPAIGADGTIYVGSLDGNLYAINPNGGYNWSYTAGSRVASSPAIGADGTIYVGSEDGKLYAINQNGTLKWSYTTGSYVDSSPSIGADGTIYVGSKDGKLYAINPNGTLKWSYKTGSYVDSSPAIGADGTIYMGSDDYKFYAINGDGTLKWSYKTGGCTTSPAIDVDGTIYVGSFDNKLYAFSTANDAQIVGDTITDTMMAGQSYTVSITVKNTGTKTWTADSGFSLGAIGGSDPFAVGLYQNLAPGETIAHGQEKTFNFTMVAPWTAGAYSPDWQMTQNGVTWFGGTLSKTITVTSSPNNAQIVGDTITDTMMAGQSYTVSITVKNTGTSAWTADSGFSLGAVGGSDPFIAGLYQNLAPGDVVTPGQEKTFSFTMTAPSTAGTYTMDWRMNQNGMTWYGETFSKTVKVLENALPNDAQIISDTIPENMAVGQSYTVSITVKNMGANPWTAADGYKLSAVGGTDPFTTTVGQDLGPMDSIAFNGIKTFTFTMTAPITAGAYTTEWRMNQNGAAWFGGTCTKTVTVNVSPWPKFRGDNKNTGLSPCVGARTNNLKWSYTTGGFVDSCPTIGADGTIYVGSWDNKLYAINPNGTLKWFFMTGNWVTSSPAIGTDGIIYVGSNDGKLYAINPNGGLKWSYMTGGYVESSPAIGADGTIYMGTSNGRIYAINHNGSLKWSYATGSYVESSPAIGADGTIYVGADNGKLYAINQNGGLKWSYATEGCVKSSPALGADGTIYVGSNDCKLYAINADGTLKWSYTTGNWVLSSPALGADGTIYVGSDGYDLYAINADGTLKWSYKSGRCGGSSPALGADGTIYVGSNSYDLYAINADGTLKWSYKTGSYVKSSPAIGADGTIYIGSEDYKLYAISDMEQLPTPRFSVSSGTYTAKQYVAITCDIPGVTIQLTNDGTDPSETSPLYNGTPILVTNNMTLKATASRTGWRTSNTANATYVINVVKNPTLSIPAGDYNAPQSVVVTCATEGATIHYTTNGIDPTESDPTVASGGTIPVNANMTLKVKAFKVEWGPSTVMSAAFTITQVNQVPMPRFLVHSGTYTTCQNVAITCDMPGVTIRYTTDGTNPVETSPVYIGIPIPVTSNMTIKATASRTGWMTSNTANATYVINVVKNPTLSIPAGTYTTPQNVVVTCATEGATIHYTTNGIDPTENDPTVVSGGTIPVNASMTLKVKAFKADWGPSAVVSAAYTIIQANQAQPPQFSVPGGTYTANQSVAITCATPGVTIRYTTNGTTPTPSSPVYTAPIPVKTDMTINAMAWKTGLTTSPMASATYVINIVNTPTLSVAAGSYTTFKNVTVTCATEGATIHYTTNGIDPTESDPTVASGGTVPVNVSMTLKIKAFKADWGPSAVVSAAYTITKVQTPQLSVPGGTYTANQSVAITCPTSGATIRYTTNGTTPTTTSTAYTKPIPVTKNMTIKAMAWRSGWVASAAASVTYTINVVQNPILSVVSGSYTTSQNVAVTCATEGATIHYTTNGNDPTEDDPTVASGGTIPVNVSTTLKVKAFKTEWGPSGVVSNTYTLTVAAPVCKPAAGSYATPQNVTVTCPTAGATIHYTSNGIEPTESDPTIVSGGTIPVNVSTTLKFKAFKDGWTPAVKTAAYTITKVQPLQFSVPGGTYIENQSVAITCPTSGVTIRYTTDGTTPTTASTAYTKPISVTKNMTIKAMAWKTGWTASTLATATYTINVVKNPVLSIAAGTYTTPQNVAVTCTTAEAAIHYTTNGNDPTEDDPTVTSGGTIPVNVSTPLKVKAFKTDWGPSGVVGNTYTLSVATPVCMPAAGSYAAPQNVKVTCATAGATIRYTANGIEPTESDPTIVSGGTIPVNVSTTLKFKAFKDGWSPAVKTAAYTITKVQALQFSVPGGTYTENQSVAITCPTSGVTIRYTTNGTTPTTASTAYTKPISVTKNMTIKAMAWKTGWTTSPLATATYTINVVKNPTLSVVTGSYTTPQNVAVTCATAGAAIHYSTNGNDPTEDDPTVASGGTIPVNVSTTLKVKAFKTEWGPSGVVSNTYTLTVAAPVCKPAAGSYATPQNVTVTCATAGATIHYTTNGVEPTESDPTIVSGGIIPVNVSTTLKFKAFKDGWTPAVKTATYTITKVQPLQFSVLGGTYTENQSVAITCPTSGVTIRYTTDGTTPTTSSMAYTKPISVTKNMTIKAMAWKTGWTTSPLATATYTINVVKNPVLSVAGGTYTKAQNVTVTCATAGAEIHYTTDGTDPEIDDLLIASGESIPVEYNMELKFRAFKTDWGPSSVVSVAYIIT